MLMKRSQPDTDKAVKQAYDVFVSLPVEDISFVVGLSSFDEYVRKCSGFQTCKGMPVHAKAGYYYNNILKDLSIDTEYEPVNTGDKIRWMYVHPANKYGVSVIGFKDELPAQMKDLFKVDYEKMFNKIVFSVVERFYKRVNWIARKPNEQIKTDLFDIFA
jgi:hypothetical protein